MNDIVVRLVEKTQKNSIFEALEACGCQED